MEVLETPVRRKKIKRPIGDVVDVVDGPDDHFGVDVIDTRVIEVKEIDHGGTPPPIVTRSGGDDRPNGANGNWLLFGLIGTGVLMGGYGYYLHKKGDKMDAVLFGVAGVVYVLYFGAQLRFPLFGNNIEGDAD